MEEKRFTKKIVDDGTVQISYADRIVGCYHRDEMIRERLCELEDKIESGTLIELPCKVGDTVYWVWDEYNDITKEQIVSIKEWKVDRIQINENDWSVRGVDKPLENGDIPFFWCHSSRYKICWFLAREKAEKRLKELQNG